MTVGGLAAAGVTAVVVVIAVFGGQVAGNAPAVAAPPATNAPLVDLAAQAGDDGPLLSAADLAAMRNAVGTQRIAGLASQSPNNSPVSGLASDGIPSTALAAYEQAATREAQRNPQCGLPWPLLAGIGRVESDHGRFAGAVLHADGVSSPRIIGIPLDGHGTALIRDTDRGRLDGDTVYDRAVGPMQFIPSTWAGWGVDANNDGVKDPFNIYDAAAASADYLCAAGRDLTTTRGQVRAILSYNYSYDYVSMVMGLEHVYATQVGITVPVLPTAPDQPQGPPKQKPPLPPVDPGKPRGAPTPSPTPTPTPRSSAGSSPAVPSSPVTDPSSSDSSSGGDPSASDSPSDSSVPSPSSEPGTSPTPSDPLPSDSTSDSAGGSSPGSEVSPAGSSS